MSSSSIIVNQPGADEIAVRAALDRVLSSTVFANVGRLKRFLAFIVEQTVSGGGDKLKEFPIGIEVFEKPDSFDPRNDPIVRVQARRLRAKLAQYYETEGREEELWIELPKGSYVPSFHRPDKAPRKRTVPGAFPSQNTVAVLPFADRSPQADLEYFASGLRDEILHVLTKHARADALRVIPWTRPLHAQDRIGGILEAAEELDVAVIIDGSVRKAGDRYRITVQRIDAVRGQYVWSETFDSTAQDVFAVQEQIARAVLDELRESFSTEGSAAVLRRPTENLVAYGLYLKGRYHTSQRSEKGLRRAVDCFERAIAEDPQYALAHSGLADGLALLANYGYVSPGETFSRAASAATNAVRLEEGLAEAHTSLAHVKATLDWDWSAAEAEFLRAIQLNPHYPAAHHWYGIACLAPRGRLAEGIEQITLALRLDPVSAIFARDLAELFYFQRDFAAAADQAQRTIDSDPHFYGAYWILGLVHEQFGDFAEAIECFEDALNLVPENPRMLSALGRAQALAGNKPEARRVLKQLEELAKQRYVSPLDPAMIQLELDDREAFERLNHLCEIRCFDLIHLQVDPRFDRWRNTDQFAALLSKLAFDAPSA